MSTLLAPHKQTSSVDYQSLPVNTVENGFVPFSTGLDPVEPPSQEAELAARTRALKARKWRRGWPALALIVPAAAFYGTFVIWPMIQTVQLSFWHWNGTGVATWAGFANYVNVFTNSTIRGSLANALVLIVYFSFIPVLLGLITAAVIRKMATSKLALLARTVMFLPQIIPLVAAGLMWQWMLSRDGMVNSILRMIGLGNLARPWLGHTATALGGVGVVGAWVALGLCMLLLLAGMSKIDPGLYEAARIDGAGPIREFFAITLPSLKAELAVCITVTVIAALSAFDIVWATTRGGPAFSTMVPGVEIFHLGFFSRRVGEAAALGVVFMLLVLAIVLPIQRILKERD
jgi:raffinose/stachyose/melibiose transport system permease protein